MIRILHLSDLHLTAPSESALVSDHKANLVPKGDRQTLQDVLNRTVTEFANRSRADGTRLDAIVMTGDIANANKEGGYDAFLALLDLLGDVAPAPSRIVVVPGNHDVTAGLRPGAPERYARFVEKIRGAGFVTPLLEGIDDSPPDRAQLDRHLVTVGAVEIVPINTAGYSQVILDTGLAPNVWDELLITAERLAGSDGTKALRRLFAADAARVSETQLDMLRSMLESIRSTGRRDPVPPGIRVGVIHHQLLPVSTDEEVKGFESFTNLGLLRQFLAENDFSLVLHGHKHAPFSYVDYVVSYSDESARAREIRVVSGSAPTGRSFDPAGLFSVLSVDERAGVIGTERIPAVLAGQTLKRGKQHQYSINAPGAAVIRNEEGITVVRGDTVSAVYDRLVPFVARSSTIGDVPNLVCQIEISPAEDDIAVLYPGFGTPGDDDDSGPSRSARVAQFSELVQWWQDPEPTGFERNDGFNHGSRIVRYEGHHDQLSAAVEALATNANTSRAVVVLLQPAADKVSDPDHPFPSFCFIQFAIRSGDTPYLDCQGYFRKQETRYWWLVNVAELASLQRHAVAELRRLAKGDKRWLAEIHPGRVTTIAAKAHAGRGRPKVQVPRIDQTFRTSRELLADMAHALVWADMPAKEEMLSSWTSLISDLIPEQVPDPDGVPVAGIGLEYLMKRVSEYVDTGSAQSAPDLIDIVRALQSILSENGRYAAEQKHSRPPEARHAEWRSRVSEAASRVIELVVARLSSHAEPQSRP